MATKKGTEDGRTNAATENRKSRRQHRHTGVESADIGSADALRLQQAIIAVTKQGCQISFSYTRDGGAICIRIVGDGDENYNEYVRATEDFDTYLLGLQEDFDPGSTA